MAGALVGGRPASARFRVEPPLRPRLVVLTDIGNEPDDAESLVRLLLYANEIDIEALIASTSTWLKDRVNPSLIQERVRAYGEVLPNLAVHATGWPRAEDLLQRIYAGAPHYGLEGVGPDQDTDASRAIVAIVDRPDPRPVWFALWGGATDLAQALDSVRRTRSPQALAAFVAKVRVYSISDQDDAGPCLRAQFPQMFWIASIHGFGQYRLATWNGISGDLMNPIAGADTRLVDRDWQAANVIGKGPLGALYPRSLYILEGDTPSFLGLIPNGLNVPDRPDYGGWGGRYTRVSPHLGLYADAVDTVVGVDGQTHTSNHATLWRWREAFQNDFAARIGWSISPRRADGLHPPVLRLNGVAGHEPVRIAAAAREIVELNAAGSRDPDGRGLTLRWSQYKEPTGGVFAPPVRLSETQGERTQFTTPPVRSQTELHILLAGRGQGASGLTRYRRAIVTVTP